MTLFEQDGSDSAVPAFSVGAGVKIGGCTRLYNQSPWIFISVRTMDYPG